MPTDADMKEIQQYREAVSSIKQAILHSQYRAAKLITGEQLSLYFGIGCYISHHSRKEAWGTGALERISTQLSNELPGLRGFSTSSLKNMRTFFEFWNPFINRQPVADDLDKTNSIDINVLSLQCLAPVSGLMPLEAFLSLSFSHHIEILRKTSTLQEAFFYIQQAFQHKWDKYELHDKLKADLYRRQGTAADMDARIRQSPPDMEGIILRSHYKPQTR